MRSQHLAPPPAPDDDDYSPEPTRHDRVMAELARRSELVAVEDRAIAQAHARRAERLVELQDWSEDTAVATELHGNPDPAPAPAAPADTATPLTASQARATVFSRWENNEVARRTVVSETACLTRLAERTVDRLMDEARWLLYTAPATFQALTDGEISYRHATTLVDQMRTLPPEDQARFEEQVLPAAKTLPVGRFRERARRLRERLHPESILVRNRNALAERRSYWEADTDGMGWLHWYGTAQQTKAACDRIDGLAASLQHLGDTAGAGAGSGSNGNGSSGGSNGTTEQRTRDQLRADVTADLLLDGITPTGLGAGVTGTVMVTVSALTLLGRSDEPAILEGYGPISPEAAREIAGTASGFTRVLTHPETGVVLSLGTTRYKVTAPMRKWLRMRDETCRFPGCSRPAARSDIDHTEEWQHHGTTDQNNLAHLCEPHHRLKHLSQWTVTQEPGGILHWTSPGQRSYRTDPANPMGPPHPAPPLVAPTPRKRPKEDTHLVPQHRVTRHPSPPVPDDPPF